MSRLPDVRARIAELVSEPSSSSADARFDLGNRRVVERLATWCESLGMRAAIAQVGAREDKVNLVATLGEGPGGLVLAGHSDTVPWDEGKWSRDPFRVHEAGGRLYGLGTADMKSFLAIALEAIERLRDAPLRAPLIFVATCDEESTMAGARALCEAGAPRARAAIIGEPTGLRPVRLHKGASMYRLRLTGRAGHSSDPALGRNALDGMHTAIGVILALRAELAAAHRNDAFALPHPTMNLGAVHGGDSANRICGECELAFDLRALPGMDTEAVRAELEQRVRRALDGTELELSLARTNSGTPPFETAATSELVRATESLTGHAAGSVAFGTEAPWLQKLGMDVVVLGPGDIEVAHQPDEFLPLGAVPKTIDVLERLARTHCL